MKILAASIAQVAERFLHPGYISANPRALDTYAYPDGSPTLQLDLAEALRLDGEALASAAPGSGAETASAAVATAGPWPSPLWGVVAAALALAIWYLLRDPHRRRWRAIAPGGALLAAVLAVGACSDDPEPLPTHPPWEGVSLRDYANPEQATLALMHGIIADAVANVGQPIDILPNIQNEVGLPTRQLTEGQAYALQTYGIDGWGQEFRLSAQPAYQVTSAGPDGIFDNDDDLTMIVGQYDDENWDMSSRAWFIAEHEGQQVLLFHRWTGELFRYADQPLAEAVTGGGLFDALSMAALEADQQMSVSGAYQAAATGVDHPPLVLQIF